MKPIYKKLAYRAKRLRIRHGVTKQEAAWCALWLSGAKEESIPALADEMDRQRRANNERSSAQ